eukprot:223126_1
MSLIASIRWKSWNTLTDNQQTPSQNNEKEIKILRMYHELKSMLDQHKIDLDTLRNEIRPPEIIVKDLCERMHLSVKQKVTLRQLMRLINDNKKITKHMDENYFSPRNPDIKLDNNFGNILEMNILTVGDKSVGKTRLIQKYTQTEFKHNDQYIIHRETINDQFIDIKITEATSVIPICTQHIVDAIIMCYDKNEPKTYEYCLELRKQIINYTKINDKIIMLVACKSDEGYDEPKFEENKTQEIMNDTEWKKFDFWALECSAITGVNIENIFMTAAALFIEKQGNIKQQDICSATQIMKNNESEYENTIAKQAINLALGDNAIKWNKIKSKDKSINIATAYTGTDEKGVVTVRSCVNITVSPDEFYDFVDAQNNAIFKAKLDYDTLCVENMSVRKYDNNRCLVYSEYKPPGMANTFGVQPRDFCYIQFRKKYKNYRYKNKDNYIVAVIGYNANDTVEGYIAKKKGKVRANLFMTAFVLQKIKGSKHKSTAYYILKMDPCGYIPHSVVNYTASEKGYDIQWMRDYLPHLIKTQRVRTRCFKHILSKKAQDELLVFGYIYECINNNVISWSIIDVIIFFYTGFDEFSWDRKKNVLRIRFIDDKTITTKVKAGGWSGCLSNQIVTSKLCKWYEWEFKLNKWSKNAEIHFGFIGDPETISDYDWDTFFQLGSMHWKFSPFFITVGGNRRNNNFTTTGTKEIISLAPKQKKYEFKVECGDLFKMRLNFQQRRIHLYFKDKFINTVYGCNANTVCGCNAKIPDSVIPAISLTGAEVSVVHTDYN